MKSKYLLILLSLALSPNAEASTATWSGTAGDGDWSNSTNWGGTAFPDSSADTATFTGAATLTTLGQNINIAELVTTGSSGNLSITDSTDTLTFDSTSTALSDSAGQNITFNVATAVSGGTMNSGAGSTITFGRSLALANSVLAFGGSGTVTINGGIVGGGSSSGVTITGGTVNLDSAISGTTTGNTFIVTGGNLDLGVSLGKTVHLGAPTKNDTAGFIFTASGISLSGALQIAGTGSGTSNFTVGANISGGGTATIGAFNINNGVTAGGTENLTLSANSGTTLNFNGSIGGGSSAATINLLVSGGGIVNFDAATANAYTANGLEVKSTSGDTILQLNNSGGVALTGNSTVDSGSTIQLLTSNQMTSTATLTISGAGGATGTTGALENKTGTNTFGAVIAVGSGGATISADSAAPLTVTGGISNGGNLLTIAGAGNTTISTAPITGAGGLTMAGSGSLTLSGSNSYSGLTTVSSGSMFIINSANSATGTGPLSVAAGATFGGTGSSIENLTTSTTFAIGSSSGAPATMLVGQTSKTDANTTGVLTLQASSTTASTIQNANLVFNLDTTTAGAGNKLNVGSTDIAFNTTPGVANTTLTLNLEGSAIIAANTPYILVEGTGGTGSGTGQYSGFSVSGPNNEISGLTLAFTGSEPPAWYANSYLFLVNVGGGVDDIEVEVVPEPGTWAMMLGGLAFLLVWQRRRSAKV